jgi:hypothetical protein
MHRRCLSTFLEESEADVMPAAFRVDAHDVPSKIAPLI